MIKLDDNLLTELGLGSLPKEEKAAFLKHMYETLEMRVGTRLAEKMSDAQMAEFEQFINGNDEQGAFRWLEANFPDYKDVVAEEFSKLKDEVRPLAPQIVAASQAQDRPQPPSDGAAAPAVSTAGMPPAATAPAHPAYQSNTYQPHVPPATTMPQDGAYGGQPAAATPAHAPHHSAVPSHDQPHGNQAGHGGHHGRPAHHQSHQSAHHTDHHSQAHDHSYHPAHAATQQGQGAPLSPAPDSASLTPPPHYQAIAPAPPSPAPMAPPPTYPAPSASNSQQPDPSGAASAPQYPQPVPPPPYTPPQPHPVQPPDDSQPPYAPQQAA